MKYSFPQNKIVFLVFVQGSGKMAMQNQLSHQFAHRRNTIWSETLSLNIHHPVKLDKNNLSSLQEVKLVAFEDSRKRAIGRGDQAR